MEDMRENEIRKLMMINLHREYVLQICCGHWFWAVEKKLGARWKDNISFSHEQNKFKEGRMGSSMISALDCRTQYSM